MGVIHLKKKKHVAPCSSVTRPDLAVSVCQLLLCVSQLSLPDLQALLQRLHLPGHLLLVLPDGHLQLPQLSHGVHRTRKAALVEKVEVVVGETNKQINK